MKLGILLLSSLFVANSASANPAVISALSTPALTAEMQDMAEEDQRQTSCMALAVYHEAGNQIDKGQRAVVHVILNRIASHRYAPTPCGVVFQRGQFSFVHYGMGRLIPHNDPRWSGIVRLVRSVQAGETADPTSGAISFCNPAISRNCGRGRSVRIGAHTFSR
jgi:N-acetylmuramoyl-L-alanine amidase